jgi:hypothetical protein
MNKTNYREKSMLLVEITLDSMTKTEEDTKKISSRLLDWLKKKGLDIYE